MKNSWVYHLIADGPLLWFFIYYFESERSLEALIIFGMIVYPFIYRPVVDYYRLTALGKIEEGDYREILRHGTISYRFRYYSALMFGK